MSWSERPWADEEPYGGGRRFAENPLNWSPTIARFRGIRVRVHMTFILFVLFELLRPGTTFWFSSQWLFILFGSVLLHEFGHCFAARRVGGSAESVLLWPLGGLATVDAPRSPWPQFVTVAGGPLVNVVLAGLAAAALRLDLPESPLTDWTPLSASWGSAQAWLVLGYKVNLLLFLFNLWPMFPMDGGRFLQCALWWRLGQRRAMQVTTSVGMVAAIVLGLYALIEEQYLLLAIAVLGYLTCMQQRQAMLAGAFGEDYGGIGYAAEFPPPEERVPRRGWFARWRGRRQEVRRGQKQARLIDLQQEVDRILDKVHREGMHSLTRAERRTLEDASRLQQESDRHRGA